MEVVSKEVFIIAGPNGSGKTTVAREFLLEHGMTFLNADEIAAGIEGAPGRSVRIQAGRIFLERLYECIGLNRSFAVETTLAGSYIVKMIEQVRAAGYRISLSFIFVESPEVAIDRIRVRVKMGGHHVPDEDVIRRFFRGTRNFWRTYRKLVDSWVMYYNGLEKPVPVASGEGDSIRILDDDLFQIILGGKSDDQRP